MTGKLGDALEKIGLAIPQKVSTNSFVAIAIPMPCLDLTSIPLAHLVAIGLDWDETKRPDMGAFVRLWTIRDGTHMSDISFLTSSMRKACL